MRAPKPHLQLKCDPVANVTVSNFAHSEVAKEPNCLISARHTSQYNTVLSEFYPHTYILVRMLSGDSKISGNAANESWRKQIMRSCILVLLKGTSARHNISLSHVHSYSPVTSLILLIELLPVLEQLLHLCCFLPTQKDIGGKFTTAVIATCVFRIGEVAKCL